MRLPAHSFDECRCDLAARACRAFGGLKLKVTGTSMLPAVHPGDVVAVRHCGVDGIAAGDLVLFLKGNRLFVHRVVSVGGDALITRGDALPQADPLVCADELLGKVVRIERRGRPVPRAPWAAWHYRLAHAVLRRSALAARLFCRWQSVGARP